MKKVAYYVLADDGSSFYRSQGVFPFISDKRISFTDISNQNPGSWATVAPYDIVIFQRFFHHEHLAIIEQVQLMGKKVILDIDDDLLNVPDHNPAYDLYNTNAKHAAQCIRMADEIWVTTNTLKREYEKFNHNIHYIPNAHNDFLMPVKNKKAFNYKNKKVVYRGGNTHRMDLYNHSSDLALIAGYYFDWSFIYLGVSDNQEFFRANIRNDNVALTNKVPIIQYLNHLRQLNCPVMICPLEDTPLNQAKSNICWIEGTYAGSAFFGNTKLFEFNKYGISDFGDFINGSQRYLTLDAENEFLHNQHEISWKHICDNLLLSDVNRLRVERILN